MKRFVIVTVLSTVFVLGLFTYKTNNIKKSLTSNSCPNYGSISPEQFAKKYTVKPGDTILSIASLQLSNPSRVNELIQLNKDAYPQLSLQTPFLEVGWELFLPPDDISVSSGNILGLQGNIAEIDGNRWEIRQSPKMKYGVATSVYMTANTRFIDKKQSSYLAGDCARILYDSENHHALMVSPLK